MMQCNSKKTGGHFDRLWNRFGVGAVAMLALSGISAALIISGPTVRAQQDSVVTGSYVAPHQPESSVVTFTNSSNININDSATPPTPASPYPSTITVSGMPPTMSSLRVVINGLTHTFPDDIDIVLVGPQGQRSILMSDAGGGGDVTLLPPIGFEQSAASTLPDSATLTAGLFKPTNYADLPNDAFPAPGPTVAVNDPADLSVFEGTNPNGDWKLFVVDDANVDNGSIVNGWSIRFTVPLWTVTKAADTQDGICDADCSLREAIAAASPGEYINFSPLFNSPQTITLAGGELLINKNLTISGPGANLLTVSGNNTGRVFSVQSGSTVVVSGMKITGGNDATGSGGGIYNNGNLTLNAVTVTTNSSTHSGGGVYNHGGGTLTVTNSTIAGNLASVAGGGLYNGGTLTLSNSTIVGNSAIFGGGVYKIGAPVATIANSTISGNTASNRGGGIDVDTGTLDITNCTITDNTAGTAGSGSGLHQENGTVTLLNTIVGANRDNTTRPDVALTGGGMVSAGYNLIGNRGAVTVFSNPGDRSGTGASPLNPLLGPLANNGGPTLTHALRAGSPALDKGASLFPVPDQRGLLRPVDLPGIVNQADGSDIGAYEAQSAPTARSPFDYDGDGKTDISIYRPSNGQWWLNRSTAGLIVHTFGNSSDKITPADFTGDGKTDVAIFRPSTGEWFVLRSEDSTFYSFPFGTNGDIPVTGDFDADGKADATIFRNGQWFIQQSTAGTRIEGFGAAGDVPVVADYDGDGKSDIAIFRTASGQWWLNRSTAGLIVHTFGNSSDKPVPGDFTGDGKADVAIWRPSNGNWFVLRSEDNSFYSFPFGVNGDVPAPGDYDGNGVIDATVFRPSNATWYSSTQTQGTVITGFGASSDRPTPNAYTP